MKLTITGRHLTITDDIRAHLQKRADKIEARFGPLLELHVVITAEKHRFEAEMNVTAARAAFHAESRTHELVRVSGCGNGQNPQPNPPLPGAREGPAARKTPAS